NLGVRPGTDRRPGAPVALAPDGLTAAVGRADGTVRLLDAATGRPRSILVGGPAGLTGLRFLADARTLVARGNDGSGGAWDAATGRVTATAGVAPTGIEQSESLLSPDGGILVTLGEKPRCDVEVRDWSTGRLRGTYSGHSLTVWSLACSPDG